MENKRRFVILVLLLACNAYPFGALAQKIESKITVPVPEKEDSTYIKSFRNHFTVYTFLSRKYTSIKQPGAPGVPAFRYLPNNTYRSEEHTSELQSRENLVCRLLLEKKKTNQEST